MNKVTRKKRILIKCHKILNKEIQCAYCKGTLKEGTNHSKAASVDHLIPRADGGGNTYGNVVLACEECNQKKGHQNLTTFCKENNFCSESILKHIINTDTVERLMSSILWDQTSHYID